MMRKHLLTSLGLATLGLSLCRFTGQHDRPYRVLHPKSVVEVAGRPRTAEGLAESYEPGLTIQSEPLTEMFFEVREEEETVSIVYFLVWADEVHPLPLVHSLYKQYRSHFYGTAKDIEYVELKIEKATGHVPEVRFETSGVPGQAWFPSHRDAVVTRWNVLSKRSILGRTSRARERICHGGKTTPVVLEAITWNHLLDVADFSRKTHPKVCPLPLTRAKFRQHGATRRGHPDSSVVASSVSTVFGRLGTALYFGAPSVVAVGLVRSVLTKSVHRV